MPTAKNFPPMQIVRRMEDESSPCCDSLTASDPRKVDIARKENALPARLPDGSGSSRCQRLKSFWRRSRGYWFAISSGLLLTLYSYLFKKTNNVVVMPTVLLCRGILECLTLTAVATWKRQSPLPAVAPDDTSTTPTKAGLLMLAVATMGGFRALFIFLGLQLLDMSSMHVVLNAAPVVVTLMAACCLGEQLTWFSATSCVLLLSGIGCIFGPSVFAKGPASSATELLGLGFAAVALLFNASVSVFGKKVNAYFTQHWITAFNGASIVVTALVAYAADDGIRSLIRTTAGNATDEALPLEEPDVWPRNSSTWLLVLGTAAAGVSQQYTFFCALHYESAARTSMVRSVQMVFSWLVEVGEGAEVRLLTLLGIFVLLTAIFVITVEKEGWWCLRGKRSSSDMDVDEGGECKVAENPVCCPEEETRSPLLLLDKYGQVRRTRVDLYGQERTSTARDR